MPRQQRILRRKRLLICNTGNKAKMHIHIAVGGLPRVHTAISISYDRMCIQTIAKKAKVTAIKIQTGFSRNKRFHSFTFRYGCCCSEDSEQWHLQPTSTHRTTCNSRANTCAVIEKSNTKAKSKGNHCNAKTPATLPTRYCITILYRSLHKSFLPIYIPLPRNNA